jgi:hypothetical protein
MEAVCICLDALERQLRHLFGELQSAETLAQRVASIWAIRSHVDYMVFLGMESEVLLLEEADRLIDKALRVLIRVDPEGFTVLEDAVKLSESSAGWGSRDDRAQEITNGRVSQ